MRCSKRSRAESAETPIHEPSMRLRALDILLLLLTVIGGVLALSSSRRASALRAEYERIVHVAGDLEIKDPARLRIRAIDTGDPWHFAWRVYMPANYSMPLKHAVGGASGSSGFFQSEPQEFIARIRLTASRDGQIAIYQSYGPNVSFTTAGTSDFFAYLSEHRDELVVEQLAANEAISLAADDSATLLKISLPEELSQEARARFGSELADMIPTVLESRLGQGP